jgi:hypothetical protein
MAEFKALRVERKRVLEIEATPERVFPLLCPVREADWVPGWEYRMVFSRSGVAELGCVFTTRDDQGKDIVWVASEYEPARRIGFVWVRPELVSARLRFDVAADGSGSKVTASYEYTGLSEAGNNEVARYTEEWFGEKMRHFPAALNHYLRSGKMISAAAWE